MQVQQDKSLIYTLLWILLVPGDLVFHTSLNKKRKEDVIFVDKMRSYNTDKKRVKQVKQGQREKQRHLDFFLSIFTDQEDGQRQQRESRSYPESTTLPKRSLLPETHDSRGETFPPFTSTSNEEAFRKLQKKKGKEKKTRMGKRRRKSSRQKREENEYSNRQYSAHFFVF